MSQQTIVVASMFFSVFWTSCVILWKAPNIAAMVVIAIAGAGAGAAWYFGMRGLLNKWWPSRR